MSEVAREITIGPNDAGRRMSFEAFQRAQPLSGHNYELSRGVVEVTDVPGRAHFLVLQRIDERLAAYRAAHPHAIQAIAPGSDAKIELPELESERHPDRSIYLTPMPDDDYPWDKWTPSLCVEVVSPGVAARERDFVTKREEYLAAGVDEYWIVDPADRVIVQLTRHGDRWKQRRVAEAGKLVSALLPGFELSVADVFGMLK